MRLEEVPDVQQKDQWVYVIYKNHRRIVSERTIVPIHISFRTTPWHGNEPQWILEAYDITDKDDVKIRSFAMADIIQWKAYEYDSNQIVDNR